MLVYHGLFLYIDLFYVKKMFEKNLILSKKIKFLKALYQPNKLNKLKKINEKEY